MPVVPRVARALDDFPPNPPHRPLGGFRMARVLTALRREISERHRSSHSIIDIQRAFNLDRAAVARLTGEGRKRRPYCGDQTPSGRLLKLSAAQTRAVRHAGTNMVLGGSDKLMALEGSGISACMNALAGSHTD